MFFKLMYSLNIINPVAAPATHYLHGIHLLVEVFLSCLQDAHDIYKEAVKHLKALIHGLFRLFVTRNYGVKKPARIESGRFISRSHKPLVCCLDNRTG